MIWTALKLLRLARRWRALLIDEDNFDRDLSLEIDRLTIAIETLEKR